MFLEGNAFSCYSYSTLRPSMQTYLHIYKQYIYIMENFTRSSFGDALVSSLSACLCLKTREGGVDVGERLSICLDI